MASRHKILWHLPGVGQLRCRKTKPEILSFWPEGYLKRNGKGPYFVNLSTHTIYFQRACEQFLRDRIADTTEIYLKEQASYARGHGYYDLACFETALDYLFTALGRLAGKAVIP